MNRLALAVLLVFGMFIGSSQAGELSSVYPIVPKATGKPHPEGNLFMRINHMRLLRHDRDLTVLEGDREVAYSLKACVECHAVNGPDAEPIGYDSEEYFCRVCHDYAAVKIDCFECHNSKPEATPPTRALLDLDPPDPGDIGSYLAELKQ